MWRIKTSQVLPLQAPLIQPFCTALGDHDTLDNLLFILTLADGTKGYGEAAVATHITGEKISVTRIAIFKRRALVGWSRCSRRLAYFCNTA